MRGVCLAFIVWLAWTIGGGATAVRADEDSPTHITQAELLLMIEGGRPPAIVDVRSRHEYDKGHVPGAVHIPFWATFSRAGLVPAAHDRPVVVYSEHGPRAGLSRLALRMRGFDRVLYLDGHLQAWKKAGLPLEAHDPALRGVAVVRHLTRRRTGRVPDPRGRPRWQTAATVARVLLRPIGSRPARCRG